MDRVGVVFLIGLVLAIVVSLLEDKGEHPNAVDLKGINFSTSSSFNISTIAVCFILTGFYAAWW